MNSRAELVIDLNAVAGNYRRLVEFAAPCVPLPVVKANAYGFGSTVVGRVLRDAGAPRLLVGTLSEAMELREVGLPVQMVGSVLPHEVGAAVAADITCPVNDLESARMIAAAAEARNKPGLVDIQVDTGMGRDGIRRQDAASEIDAILKLPGLSCRGIYSHFPGALPEFGAFTREQIGAFVELLRELGRSFEYIHFGGSDGIGNFPEILKPPFTHCRTGLALYGLGSTAEILGLKPVMTLKVMLSQVRNLTHGSNIGYNFTRRLDRDCRVGTVAAGYADGIPLALSNRGEVVVHGKRCRVLGRVSMDYFNIDLSEVPEAKPGDAAICLGEGITLENWAELKQTHPHEILCSLGRRVVRTYLR